jgi:hypothetical protein
MVHVPSMWNGTICVHSSFMFSPLSGSVSAAMRVSSRITIKAVIEASQLQAVSLCIG